MLKLLSETQNDLTVKIVGLRKKGNNSFVLITLTSAEWRRA